MATIEEIRARHSKPLPKPKPFERAGPPRQIPEPEPTGPPREPKLGGFMYLSRSISCKRCHEDLLAGDGNWFEISGLRSAYRQDRHFAIVHHRCAYCQRLSSRWIQTALPDRSDEALLREIAERIFPGVGG